MVFEDWTEGTFDAAHLGPFGERVHGHTWTVRVFWPAHPPRDASAIKATLDEILTHGFDHRLLDEVAGLEPSNAGIAHALSVLLPEFVTEIWVWREGRVPCGARLRR